MVNWELASRHTNQYRQLPQLTEWANRREGESKQNNICPGDIAQPDKGEKFSRNDVKKSVAQRPSFSVTKPAQNAV